MSSLKVSLLSVVLFLILAPASIVAASLRLNWEDASADLSGFKIERLNNGVYAEIATVTPTARSYTDTATTAGTTYCYRVRAFNTAGASSPSNSACANAPQTIADGGTGTGSNSSGTTGPGISAGATFSRWTNYRFRVKIRSARDGSIGVLFRYLDDRNYYRFSWSKNQSVRRLVKVENGTPVLLGEDGVPYEAKRQYQLEITAVADSLVVAIDNQVIFSVHDSSFLHGTVALYSDNRGSEFDDVTVEDSTAGTVLLSDSFDDRNFAGWTLINENGGRPRWSAASRAMAAKGASPTYALYTKGSWTDYQLTVKVRSADVDTVGALFRFADANNFYRFSWCARTSTRLLEAVTNGRARVLRKDFAAYTPGRNYEIGLAAEASTISVFIDGTLIFSVADSTLSGGSIGLYSYSNEGSVFDNVSVLDPASGTEMLSYDFDDGKMIGWTIIDQTSKSGPSQWSVVNGELVQSNPIGGKGKTKPGTIAIVGM